MVTRATKTELELDEVPTNEEFQQNYREFLGKLRLWRGYKTNSSIVGSFFEAGTKRRILW